MTIRGLADVAWAMAGAGSSGSSKTSDRSSASDTVLVGIAST
ncbi:MAG: hypothetical protein U0989_20460 [Azonexus sp.]|nr:hypothetical protein [Azonexus sp.]MDZ4317124.1 hypothetical protein [Azonexus sp.]